MKRALIDSRDNRVVQIADADFDVSPGLFWVDCPDDTGTYYLYDPEELTFEDPHAHSKDEFGNPVEPFSMQRMRAYPPLGDQLDLLYKEIRDTGSISTEGTWFQSITAIKAAIPKPADDSVKVQHLNSDGTLVDIYEDVRALSTSGSGQNAIFKFRRANGALQVLATSEGSGYAVDDTITVLASDLEESSNVVITVTDVTNSGGIVSLSI